MNDSDEVSMAKREDVFSMTRSDWDRKLWCVSKAE